MTPAVIGVVIYIVTVGGDGAGGVKTSLGNVGGDPPVRIQISNSNRRQEKVKDLKISEIPN